MARSLGIDLGTSSVKLTLVDDEGQVQGTTSRDYAPSCPEAGWKEIDPELWWAATCEACRELLGAAATGAAGATDAADVVAVAVTGQMHTTVLVGADGRSVRPAIMWNDVRSPGLVARVRASYEAAGLHELARVVSTGSPAASLA